LDETLPETIDRDDGRPGMTLWEILVLGALRINCNWDYDKLIEMADNHQTLRQMLERNIYNRERKYPLQTLKDNVSLLSPEILDRINKVVVEAGHNLVKKKENKDIEIMGKCDSFVVETNVHFPTDINLLWDAVRKVIQLTASLSDRFHLKGWRQWKNLLRKTKRLFRRAQKANTRFKRRKVRSEQSANEYLKAYRAYIEECLSIIERAKECADSVNCQKPSDMMLLAEIERFIRHGERQINQIERRVFEGEKIPQKEKVFSVFEEHTEWISKGKAGVPQELGLKVCILKDQYGFILSHQVMEKETDDEMVVPFIKRAIEMYPQLNGCSFDKGFWSPENNAELRSLLDKLILPKKGRMSAVEKAESKTEDYLQLRRAHSSVESSISALENHGLDRCPDHGLDGFNRYVALSVLARNIQILGDNLQQKELEKLRRHEKKVA
jgi:transposase, IS5 family